jgi:hypothetical protein
MEMCDCFVDLIEKHNEQLEHMYELAELLLETFPGIEQTDVNDAFCNVMNDLTEQSVQLCAMANCLDDVNWYMDEEGFVFTDGTNDEEGECECCDGPRISDYLN